MQDWKKTVSEMVPMRNCVILQKLKERSRSEGGLFLPETSDRTTLQGRVVGVGPDCKSLKLGDVVIFDKYLGMGLGEDYLLLEEDEVIAKIEDEEEDHGAN